jgi:hypothetical protein
MKISTLTALLLSTLAATQASAFDWTKNPLDSVVHIIAHPVDSVSDATGAVTGKVSVDNDTLMDQARLALFVYTKSVSRENPDGNCDLKDGGGFYDATKDLVKLYPSFSTAGVDQAYKNNPDAFKKVATAFAAKYDSWNATNKRKLTTSDGATSNQVPQTLNWGYYSTQNIGSKDGPYTKENLFKMYPFMLEAAYSHEMMCGRAQCLLLGKRDEANYPYYINPDVKTVTTVNIRPESYTSTRNDPYEFDVKGMATPKENVYWKNVLYKAYFFSLDDLKAINTDLSAATKDNAKALNATLAKVIDCDTKHANDAVVDSCYADSVFALDAIKVDPSFEKQNKILVAEYNKMYQFGTRPKSEQRNGFGGQFGQRNVCASEVRSVFTNHGSLESFTYFIAPLSQSQKGVRQ